MSDETIEVPGVASGDAGMDSRIARLLRLGTYLAIALIAVGVVLMLATGRSPLDVAPAFDPARLVADLAALQPAGFLWLGLVVVLLTPAARVAVAALGYARVGDRSMALIAVLVLLVILTGVLLGTPGLLGSIGG
ncbi:MAG: DUF1634 domain-containing protein [Chloroflexota bacterium]